MEIQKNQAHNGEEAVELVKVRAGKCRECGDDKYSLIFMDINMPIMDGIEATQKINELIRLGQIPHIPIIALSAGEPEEEKYASLGFAASVSKPISRAKFLQTIGMYLGKSMHA